MAADTPATLEAPLNAPGLPSCPLKPLAFEESASLTLPLEDQYQPDRNPHDMAMEREQGSESELISSDDDQDDGRKSANDHQQNEDIGGIKDQLSPSDEMVTYSEQGDSSSTMKQVADCPECYPSIAVVVPAPPWI